MDGLEREMDRLAAQTEFSGVVRVDRHGAVALIKAYGLAHRGHKIANTVETQFALASGAKGFTALVVASLIEQGGLELATTARSLLGTDLPLISDEVTVEHLLCHRSGIGDYLDEDIAGDISDYPMTVPVHQLETTEAYLPILGGRVAKFGSGQDFSYCNGGFVVLALLAERASGMSFYELVDQRVCRPAGLSSTAFLRSDELDGRAAMGYLDASAARSNVLHLPVRGSGDGGIYSTATDIHALWDALLGGRIVSPRWVAEMTRSRSIVESESMRYGLGFWLHRTTDAVMLEGYDAGVSFRSVHQPTEKITHTVISNTSSGAWPLTKFLDEFLEI